MPHATGTIAGDTLRFEFAYASGPFRDTFVYHPETRSWTVRLESGDARTGGWRHFGEYEVRAEATPPPTAR